MKSKFAIFFALACFFSSNLLFAQSTEKTIKVGLVSILSGDVSATGTDFVRAAQLAADQYHKKNPNIKFEFVVEDDEYSQAKGLSAIKKLLTVNKVDAIINMSTPTINSSYNLLKQNGLPVMQLGLFDKSDEVDNIFMLQGKFEPTLEEYGKFIAEKTKDEPTEIFYFEDPSVLHYVAVLKKAYGKELPETAVAGNNLDFGSLVSKSISRGTKHVIFGLMPDAGSELMKRFAQQKYNPQFYSVWSLEIEPKKYLDKLGNSEQLMNIYYASTSEDVNAEVLKNFREKYNSELMTWAEFGYDCFQVLAESYDSDRATWLKNIQNYTGTGASGEIKFDATGTRIAKGKILQFKNRSVK